MANYNDMIKLYAKGEINLQQLSDFIDERLFDLRQDPTSMTEEQTTLSGIELIICEVNDGYRTKGELDEFIKSLIYPSIPMVALDTTLNNGLIITSSYNINATLIPIKPEAVVRDYSFPLLEFA